MTYTPAFHRILISIIAGLFIFGCSLFVWIVYPSNFTPKDIVLASGTFPVHISENLEEANIVRSSFALHTIIYLRGSGKALVPGDYRFEKRESIFKVASRITSGDFRMEQKRITVPEGSTNAQIADLLVEVFPDFNKDEFLTIAAHKQGYLFPDTYYLLSTSTTEVLTKLNDTFNYQVRDLQAESISRGKAWNEVVIMASILEEEANTPEDFKIVSGILWKRLGLGMPLQVDVATSTYQQIGFPPQPLSNPGLVTLEAALNPATTTHLYYLTGKDGLMHYAETYERHLDNINAYLR